MRAYLIDAILESVTEIDFDGSDADAKLCELLGQKSINDLCAWPTDVGNDHLFHSKPRCAGDGPLWTVDARDSDWRLDVKGRMIVLGSDANREECPATMTLDQVKQRVSFMRTDPATIKPTTAILIEPRAGTTIEVDFDGTPDVACRLLGGTKEQLRLRSACFDPGDVLAWSRKDIDEGREGATFGCLSDRLVDEGWPKSQLKSRVPCCNSGDVLVFLDDGKLVAREDVTYWGDWDGAESWDMLVAGRVLIMALSWGEAGTPRITIEQAARRAVFHNTPGMVTFSTENAVVLLGEGASDEQRAKAREHNAQPGPREQLKKMRGGSEH